MKISTSIRGPQRKNSNDLGDPLTFPLNTTVRRRFLFLLFMSNVSISVENIILEFGIDIHGAQRMDHNDFSDPLTFHLPVMPVPLRSLQD